MLVLYKKKAVNYFCSSGGSGKTQSANKKAHGTVSVSTFHLQIVVRNLPDFPLMQEERNAL